jgi:hypothetical protein
MTRQNLPPIRCIFNRRLHDVGIDVGEAGIEAACFGAAPIPLASSTVGDAHCEKVTTEVGLTGRYLSVLTNTFVESDS